MVQSWIAQICWDAIVRKKRKELHTPVVSHLKIMLCASSIAPNSAKPSPKQRLRDMLASWGCCFCLQPKARDQVIKTLLRYLHTDVLTCLHESDEELIEEQKKVGSCSATFHQNSYPANKFGTCCYSRCIISPWQFCHLFCHASIQQASQKLSNLESTPP